MTSTLKKYLVYVLHWSICHFFCMRTIGRQHASFSFWFQLATVSGYWCICSSWNASFSWVIGHCVWHFRLRDTLSGPSFPSSFSCQFHFTTKNCLIFYFHLWAQLFILLPARLLLTWLKENRWNDIAFRSEGSLVLRWHWLMVDFNISNNRWQKWKQSFFLQFEFFSFFCVLANIVFS